MAKKYQFSYPRGNFPRLCLIGNSNVGKSSITRQILSHPKWYKGKIGKTAGSTVRLTIINDPSLNYHVIDLPGFGHMKHLARSQEEHVQEQILHYIEIDKKNIFLMLMVVNIERLDEELEKWYFQNQDTIPLTIEFLQFLLKHDIPTLLILNKVDRLNHFQEAKILEKLNRVLNDFGLSPVGIAASNGVLEIVKCSAKTGDGLKELKRFIAQKAQLLDMKQFDPRSQLMDKPPINHVYRAQKKLEAKLAAQDEARDLDAENQVDVELGIGEDKEYYSEKYPEINEAYDELEADDYYEDDWVEDDESEQETEIPSPMANRGTSSKKTSGQKTHYRKKTPYKKGKKKQKQSKTHCTARSCGKNSPQKSNRTRR